MEEQEKITENIQNQFKTSESENTLKSPLIQQSPFFDSILKSVKSLNNESSYSIENLNSKKQDTSMLKNHVTELNISEKNNVVSCSIFVNIFLLKCM